MTVIPGLERSTHRLTVKTVFLNSGVFLSGENIFELALK